MARSRRNRTEAAGSDAPAMFDDGTRDAGGVGATLRAERQRQGQQLAEVAARLKIRRVHLAAIEDDRFDQLPPGTYAANFIRAYATHLGLDAGEMLRRYRQALDGDQARVELNFPQPLQESRLPSGLLIGVSVAIAALAFGAWALLGQDRSTLPRVDSVPPQLLAAAPPPPPPAAPEPAPAVAQPPAPVPAPLAEAPRPAAPAATPPAAAAPSPSASATPAATSGAGSTGPASTRPAASAPMPAPVAAPPPAAAAPASPPARAVSAAAPAPAPAPVAPQPAPAVPQPPPGQPAAAAAASASDRALGDVGKGRVVVTALAESWVQVRDTAGSIVFMRIMKAGEAYHAPNRRGLLLTTGNAGSIEIKVDGRTVPSVGQVGRVRRDLSLDPDSLLAPAPRGG